MRFLGEGAMGELIVGGGLGRPDGKYLQILDLLRFASLWWLLSVR